MLTIAGLLAVFLDQAQLTDPLVAEARESFVRLFRLNREANVPTWFSSSILLLSALLLGSIAMSQHSLEARIWRHWMLLAFVFLFLSMDETAQIHEMLVRPTRHLLGLGGPLYFAWIVPVGASLILFVAVYARFLSGLPFKTRRLFLLSGILYVAGALGLESIGSLIFTQVGGDCTAYEMATVTEEFLEMAGIVVFLKALMEYPRVSEMALPARSAAIHGTSTPEINAR
jgi:hypothetical protein